MFESGEGGVGVEEKLVDGEGDRMRFPGRKGPVLEFRNISWWLKSLDLIFQTSYLALLRHFSPEMVLVN